MSVFDPSPWDLTLAATREAADQLRTQAAEAFVPSARMETFRTVVLQCASTGFGLLHEWVKAAKENFNLNPGAWPAELNTNGGPPSKNTPPKPPSYREVRAWMDTLPGFTGWLLDDMPEAAPLSDAEKAIGDRAWAETTLAGIRMGIPECLKEWRSLRVAELNRDKAPKDGARPASGPNDLASFTHAADGKAWRTAARQAEPDET